MHHDEIVVARHLRDDGKLEAVRRRVDELAAFDERRRLRQPRGIPERTDLATALKARSRSAVEAVEGWSLEEEGTHHALGSPIATRVPSDRTR